MAGDQADTIDRLRQAGVVQSVGDILEGEERATPSPPARFSPARLDGTPELPEPGLYFGMSDEDYHALPALSSHGIKYLAASPMLFWSRTAWLSPKRQREVAERAEKPPEEKLHQIVGKAYHCRIMEGREQFDRRFIVELDPEDYPNALVHTDQIKAAIGRHREMVSVKPCSTRKDELQAQLEQLRDELPDPPGIVVGLAPVTALQVSELKDRIREYKTEQPVKPWAKVTDTMPDSDEEYQRTAVKADWIRQLLELDPEAEIFDVIQQRFLAEHNGKTVIPLQAYEQLEIAAAMIERDPELQHAFKGGHPEVTLIWYCPKTGVPMKARVDYLKIKRAIDLKSIGNQRERSIENAIRFEIASYHYNIQPAVYIEGVDVLRQLVREKAASVVHVAEGYTQPADEAVAWALKWASHRGETDWLWVFQQKGDAPITRGLRYPLGGTTHLVTLDIVSLAKKRFLQFSQTFGTDPWLDIAPIYDIADEDIPQSATEI